MDNVPETRSSNSSIQKKGQRNEGNPSLRKIKKVINPELIKKDVKEPRPNNVSTCDNEIKKKEIQD